MGVQKRYGGFEADIYCPSINTVIEYDGEFFHSGKDSAEREHRKNQYFIESNIMLFRIKETKSRGVFDCKKTEYGYEINTTYTQEYDFIKPVINEIVHYLNVHFHKNHLAL